MSRITEGLARIARLQQEGPQLTPEEREQYQKIGDRLARARADLRRATKQMTTSEGEPGVGIAKKFAAAQRAVARAEAARDEFAGPRCAKLYAPKRIIATFEGHWGGGRGAREGVPRGVHVQRVEMRLDHVDIPGPHYVQVRVLSDVGGPPTNARKPPHAMGMAWFAVADQIARKMIEVLPDEEGES